MVARCKAGGRMRSREACLLRASYQASNWRLKRGGWVKMTSAPAIHLHIQCQEMSKDDHTHYWSLVSYVLGIGAGRADHLSEKHKSMRKVRVFSMLSCASW